MGIVRRGCVSVGAGEPGSSWGRSPGAGAASAASTASVRRRSGCTGVPAAKVGFEEARDDEEEDGDPENGKDGAGDVVACESARQEGAPWSSGEVCGPEKRLDFVRGYGVSSGVTRTSRYFSEHDPM